MTTLAEHWSKSMDEGDHKCLVQKYKLVKAKTGNSGVEFTLINKAQKTAEATFWLTDKALWKLAGFARACGLTRDQGAEYDPYEPNSHDRLVNRSVVIQVELNDEGYPEAKKWRPVIGNSGSGPDGDAASWR